MGVFLQELFLPFSEILRQGVVGFFGHYVLVNLGRVLDFLVDGVGVQIHNEDSHIGLDSVEVQGSHIFLHIGHQLACLIFECQLDIIGLGTIPSLDVLLQGQDGNVGVHF